MFPENIVNARELRVFIKSGEIQTAMYSDFVSDDTGAIVRRRKAMRTFYGKTSNMERLLIMTAADQVEREMNPDLGPIASKICKAGFSLCHPEANYHVSDGATVFFEINEVKIDRVIGNRPPSLADPNYAEQLVLLMYALSIKDFALRYRYFNPINYKKLDYFIQRLDIAHRPIQEVYTMAVWLRNYYGIVFPYQFAENDVKLWLETNHKGRYEEKEKSLELARKARIRRIIEPTVMKLLELECRTSPP